MTKDVLIIDGDGHYVEDVAAWSRHVPARMGDMRPKLAIESDGVERFTIGDLWALPTRNADRNQMGGMTAGDGLTPRTRGSTVPHIQKRKFMEGHPGGIHSRERLELMDHEGIAISVLYPTLALASIPGVHEPKVACALATALNDWVVQDFCSVDPNRLVPVATLALHDPASAAAELKRCVTQLGMRVAFVAPSTTMGRTIDDPAHDIVWKTAADLGIPMTTHHGSGGGGLNALGRDRNKTWLGAHAMGHAFEAMAAIVGLYTSGVFQRYPTLEWGFMEAGTGWLPFWLHQIHEHAERMGELVPGLAQSQDIRDVFRDRCIVTAEADDLFINQAFDAAGDECVVWASDFPHFDCSLPGLVDEALARSDLSPVRMQHLMARNAIEFFKLQDLVAKVGRNASPRVAGLTGVPTNGFDMTKGNP